MRLVVYKRVNSHCKFGEVTDDGDRDLAKGPQAGIAYGGKHKPKNRRTDACMDRCMHGMTNERNKLQGINPLCKSVVYETLQ